MITTPSASKALLLFCLVTACGTSVPQINPTTRTSTDPVLTSILTTFKNACIENTPTFSETRMKSAFSANRPSLAPGMIFIASGEAGRSCRVTIRGYGKNRPLPTVGDINNLGQRLHARIGGSFKPKRADTGAGSAQVKANRKTYNIFVYVNQKGDLSLSVFE